MRMCYSFSLCLWDRGWQFVRLKSGARVVWRRRGGPVPSNYDNQASNDLWPAIQQKAAAE